MTSFESFEDRLIQKIFAVSLEPVSTPSNDIVFLEDLAQELRDEKIAPPLHMHGDIMDRLLMARLMLQPAPGLQWPFHYLLTVYSRASAEARAVSAATEKRKAEQVHLVAKTAKELTVSYANLALTMDVFPAPEDAEERGVLQLLDALDKREAITPQMSSDQTAAAATAGATPMPPGFLDDFSEQFEHESLPAIIEPVVLEISRRLQGVSPLGEFNRPLQHLVLLTSVLPIARTMVSLPSWAPPPPVDVSRSDGRAIARKSILGPAFSISPIPDAHDRQLPLVATECFPRVDSSFSIGEVRQSIDALQITSNGLHTTLRTIVYNLAKHKDTRDPMLQWFALALESNREREKMEPNAAIAGSSGFFINLSAVLLRMCEPFLDPSNGKAWGKLDLRYVQENTRIDFMSATKMNMDEQEATSLRQHSQSNGQATFAPHFICECYFLTVKCLHLGLMKAISSYTSLIQEHSRLRDAIEDFQAQMSAPGMHGSSMQAMLSGQVKMLQSKMGQLAQMMYATTAAVQEPVMLRNALAFYRLTAVWLLREASPSYASGLEPDFPLPTPAPVNFRFLPEYIVEDMADLLITIARMKPDIMMDVPMDEVTVFLIVFLASPHYIRNPYMRSKLADVLRHWMPRDQEEEDFRQPRRRGAINAAVEILFETNAIVQQHFVRSLLQLYNDIEHTSRNNEFYEKFAVRHTLGTMLVYLWSLPNHRAVWRKLSQEPGDLYTRFIHHLETDGIHLLDESLKLLKEAREYEQREGDLAAWRALMPDQQQQERATHAQNMRQLQYCLQLARVVLHLMELTTTDIVEPWLKANSVKRIAGMLNYFLKYLTGKERKQLRIKDGEKYEWDPKQLLSQIATVYVHLARRDSQGAFAAAIAADKRCYYDEMFPEAAQVLRHFHLLPEDDIEELEQLSLLVASAQQAAQVEDAAEEDAPEEFFDPITSEIMDDPVTLPSGNDIDRETILRHMLSDPTDPFNRQPIKESDLKPNVDLKARIQAWREERVAAPMSE